MVFRFAPPKDKDWQPPVKTKRKKFAPWETIFDEMFMFWFSLDSPRRDEDMEIAGEAR